MDVKHLADFVEFSTDKLRKHNLFQTDRFFMDVYCLRPNQTQRPHAHEGSDKVYVVLEGRCRFIVGEDSADHDVGTAVMARAGETHGVMNPGPGDLRLLVMMTSPPSR
jgi:mannose-6-phosphate isomerase-like protein (cupin superfamily)